MNGLPAAVATGIISSHTATAGRRVVVEVIAPPLIASAFCAWLRTLPEVWLAETATDDRFSSMESWQFSETVSRLSLRVVNGQQQILPFPAPVEDWVLIQRQVRCNKARGGKAAAAISQQPAGRYSRKTLRGYALLVVQDGEAELRMGLQAAAEGRVYCSPEFSSLSTATTEAGVTAEALPELSPRQSQVAQLAAAGLSNAEIAARLFVDITTVKTHLNDTFRRLGIQRRSQINGQLKPKSPNELLTD